MTPALLLIALAVAAPEEIAPFWRDTLERLAHVPMNAVVEPVKEPLPYRKFRVTLTSLDNVQIRGYLAVPIRGEGGGKPLPAIITAPGYGGSQQGIMLDECQRGYVVLQLYPRAQGESAALWNGPVQEKLVWGIEKPQGFYYQGAYADMVRGVDFLTSYKDVDPERIAAIGTSQGGGFVLALAGLDKRVKSVVAHVPFLCDFRTAARTERSLVKQILDKAGRNEERYWGTLDYFDPVQLGANIRVPALVSTGGKDTTCPAVTIRAVFDRLAGVKSLVHYPELPHTSSEGFYRMTWEWVGAYLR